MTDVSTVLNNERLYFSSNQTRPLTDTVCIQSKKLPNEKSDSKGLGSDSGLTDVMGGNSARGGGGRGGRGRALDQSPPDMYRVISSVYYCTRYLHKENNLTQLKKEENKEEEASIFWECRGKTLTERQDAGLETEDGTNIEVCYYSFANVTLTWTL